LDWFSILKNQVASTKGKQFQLDFSQPMVEEDDDCKRKFFAVIDKLKNLEIDGLVKKPGEFIGSKGFFFEKDSKRILEMFFAFNDIENVPNEVFCYVIDQFKDTEHRNFKVSRFDNRIIQTVKGERFPQGKDEILYSYLATFSKINARPLYFTVNIMSYPDTRPFSDKVEETIRRVISF